MRVEDYNFNFEHEDSCYYDGDICKVYCNIDVEGWKEYDDDGEINDYNVEDIFINEIYIMKDGKKFVIYDMGEKIKCDFWYEETFVYGKTSMGYEEYLNNIIDDALYDYDE